MYTSMCTYISFYYVHMSIYVYVYLRRSACMVICILHDRKYMLLSQGKSFRRDLNARSCSQAQWRGFVGRARDPLAGWKSRCLSLKCRGLSLSLCLNLTLSITLSQSQSQKKRQSQQRQGCRYQHSFRTKTIPTSSRTAAPSACQGVVRRITLCPITACLSNAWIVDTRCGCCRWCNRSAREGLVPLNNGSLYYKYMYNIYIYIYLYICIQGVAYTYSQICI